MVRCLSFHARYRCGRSGACCTSNWPVPIEADRLARMQAAAAAGTLRTAGGTGTWMTMPAEAPEDAPALLAMSGGRCVFFDTHGGHSCRVHETLGHDALPLACRQFPRIAVRDPRGISVTLSHYCPTAASLLDDGGPVTVAEAPPAFPPGADYEGLDASTALPPLLRPDMLMDWASWWRWETQSVAVLTSGEAPVAVRLGRLRSAVESLLDWSPDRGPLAPRVDRAFADSSTNMSPFDPDAAEVQRRLAEIDAAIPSDLRPDPWRPSGLDESRVGSARTARFLAAHAFANWTAHLGDGLQAWLRSIEAAFVCLRAGLDAREADLRLRHLASPNRLAKAWSSVTPPPDVSPS